MKPRFTFGLNYVVVDFVPGIKKTVSVTNLIDLWNRRVIQVGNGMRRFLAHPPAQSRSAMRSHHAAQVQLGLENLQERRLHSLSGQCAPALG